MGRSSGASGAQHRQTDRRILDSNEPNRDKNREENRRDWLANEEPIQLADAPGRLVSIRLPGARSTRDQQKSVRAGRTTVQRSGLSKLANGLHCCGDVGEVRQSCGKSCTRRDRAVQLQPNG